MPCLGRRNCAARFVDLQPRELNAILFYHGHCGGCGKDLHPEPGSPMFDTDPVRGQLRPLCVRCRATAAG
jgi:hypothetical protein